jgi:hypothetical protein
MINIIVSGVNIIYINSYLPGNRRLAAGRWQPG